MSITKEDTKVLVLGITEAKIGKITANTESTYTVSDLLRISGIKEVLVTATTKTVESTGDEVLQGKDVIKQGYDIKFENQKIPLDAISLINGSMLVESDSQISLLEGGSDAPAEFYFQIKSNKINGKPGSFHCEYFVVKGLLDIGPKSGDYYTCSFTGTAYGRQKPITKVIDGVTKTTQYPMRNFIFNETDSEIAVSDASGVFTLTGNIVKTDAGGTIGAVLTGTTFASEAAAETLSNYTFSAGTTGLTLVSATYISANTVAFACTGTAAAGTLSITPKAAACANGLAATAGTFVIAA